MYRLYYLKNYSLTIKPRLSYNESLRVNPPLTLPQSAYNIHHILHPAIQNQNQSINNYTDQTTPRKHTVDITTYCCSQYI